MRYRFIVGIALLIVLFVIIASCFSKPEPVSLEEDCMNIVRLSYAAFNEGDWPSFADLHSKAYVQHAPDFKYPIAWRDYELSCRIAHGRLPGLKYSIEDIFAVKNKVACRVVWKCPVYSSPYGSYFPSGVSRGSSICIIRIEDAKIVEEWYEYDTVGIQKVLRSAKSREHMK